MDDVEKMSPRINPILILGLGILSVSTASIFIKFAQEDAPSLTIAFFRLAFATLLILPPVLLRYRNEIRKISAKALVLLLLSGFFLSVHFAAWITSLEYTSVASSVVLVTTTPLWVAAFSPLILKEPISKYTVTGMIIALMGGFIIGIGDFCSWSKAGLSCPLNSGFLTRGEIYGDILALIGAITAAFYIMIGRKSRKEISLLVYIFYVYGFAAFFLLLFTLVTSTPLSGYPPTTYVWALLLAIFPQLLGHSSFNWALRYLSAGYVSITLLGEPVGSTILAMVFLAELPTLPRIMGGISILFGIFLSAKSETRN